MSDFTDKLHGIRNNLSDVNALAPDDTTRESINQASQILEKVETDTLEREGYVFDFSDGIIHDYEWLRAQPAGTSAPVFSTITNPNVPATMSMGIGEGRNGSNALIYTFAEGSEYLRTWLYPFKHFGKGYLVRITDPQYATVLPPGKRANRLEVYYRIEKGYASAAAAVQPPRYPNHKNMDVGTNHVNFNNPRSDFVEDNNMKFYFNLWARYDKTEGDWVRLVLNEQASFQRNMTNFPNNNPTMAISGLNFWESFTRIYFDWELYPIRDAGIPGPVRVWIDSIRLFYQPPTLPVDILIGDGQPEIKLPFGGVTSIPIQLINHSSDRILGYLNSPEWKFTYTSTDGKRLPQPISLAPGTTEIVGTVKSLKAMLWSSGVTFVPVNQIITPPGCGAISLSCPYIEKRYMIETGPFDGDVASSWVRLDSRS